MLNYDAIVLAGGKSSRFGGVDKTAVEVEGARIIDRVLAGVSGASTVQVIGPEVQGGPVAAIAAALATVTAPIAVTLAGDQPWIGPAVPLLVEAVADADVAVLVAEGRRHYLAAAWKVDALRVALSRLDSPFNAPVHRLFENAHVADVADTGGWSRDIDSPADLPD